MSGLSSRSHTVRMLLFICGCHTGILLLFFGSPVLEMVGAGWWNTAGPAYPLRSATFWSLIWGLTMGVTALAVSRSRLGPPALGLLGLLGASAMPIGGFWFLFPAAWLWHREQT